MLQYNLLFQAQTVFIFDNLWDSKMLNIYSQCELCTKKFTFTQGIVICLNITHLLKPKQTCTSYYRKYCQIRTQNCVTWHDTKLLCGILYFDSNADIWWKLKPFSQCSISVFICINITFCLSLSYVELL